MHVRMARYTYTGDGPEMARRAAEGMLPILESQRTQLQGLRDELDSGKLERAEGRTRVDAIRKDSEAKIEAVLRPEQATEYQKMLARREQLRKQAQQRGMAPAAKPPAPQPEAQP